jgi:Spy/CpxP family protein refolding chaperone
MAKEVTMLGFIFGTVCLIGLIKVLRRGHGGYGRWGGHAMRGHGGYGPRRWLMRSMFERLQTTPGQEKAIVGAIDELREERVVLREEAQQTRSDLARALGGGFIDDGTLEETFARHDRLLAQVRVSFVEALKKVSEALDERQRKQLADMLQGGRFSRVWA